MSGLALNIVLVLVFVIIGGVFSASEIALVSLRESQIKALSQRGKRGARVAKLYEDPNRFLSAVQVGVTLAGFLSAAFGASTLAGDLAPVLEGWGLSPAVASVVALVAITVAIAYVSIVLGELAAKRLALQRPEAFALALAPLVDRMATAFRPVIWLLSKSTDIVVKLLGGDPEVQREQMTEEELRDLVAGHETLGGEERRLIEEVFAAGERQLHEVMVPRTEVDFLDESMPVFKAVRLVVDKPHSRYPVYRTSQDEIVGFVHVRDLFSPDVSGRGTRVGEIAREVKMLPATKQLLPALSDMRREGHHLAIVVDEYGGTDGIVTLEDLVEELVGEIRDEYDVPEEQTKLLHGGDVEVDGLLSREDFLDRTGVALPEGPYETVAGFVLGQLGRVPEVGAAVEALDHRFTVTELDGRRIARVRMTALHPVDSTGASTDPAAQATGSRSAPGDERSDEGTASRGTGTGATSMPAAGSAE